MIKAKQLYMPAIAMTALFVGSIAVLQKALSESYVSLITNELHIELDSIIYGLSVSVDSPSYQAFDEFIEKTPFAQKRHEISIISEQGKLIFDTGLSKAQLIRQPPQNNHPEFSNALKLGVGNAMRFSEAKGIEYLHVAKPFALRDFYGVARISVPIEYINSAIDRFITFFFLVMCTALAVMLVITYLNNRQIVQHLAKKEDRYKAQYAQQTREVELLNRLASLLAACSTIHEAEQVVKDLAPKILGDVLGAVSIMRSSRNLLEVKLVWGGDWIGDNIYPPDDCWALRKGKSHMARDDLAAMPCKHMPNVNDEQVLCIPLIAHGNTVGMMHLAFGDEEECRRQYNLCRTVAEHIGLAIANLELQEELRRQALRDPLTGLFNRRYMEDAIEQDMNVASRKKQSFSLLMVDMDHFKIFNDNFGHDAGDFVLKQLAGVLLKATREQDKVCRIGGEEIAILLPDTSLEESILAADNVCNAVRDISPKLNGQMLGKVTVSIGIATYPESSNGVEGLLKDADIALYQAKENGRDQHVHSGLKTTAVPLKTLPREASSG